PLSLHDALPISGGVYGALTLWSPNQSCSVSLKRHKPRPASDTGEVISTNPITYLFRMTGCFLFAGVGVLIALALQQMGIGSAYAYVIPWCGAYGDTDDRRACASGAWICCWPVSSVS